MSSLPSYDLGIIMVGVVSLVILLIVLFITRRKKFAEHHNQVQKKEVKLNE